MSKLLKLKNGMDDRQKVSAWLDHIQEKDETCRAEVLEQCAKDKESRAYYVKRYTEDCAA